MCVSGPEHQRQLVLFQKELRLMGAESIAEQGVGGQRLKQEPRESVCVRICLFTP